MECSKGPANLGTNGDIEMSVGNTDCLNGAGQKFSDYFSGTATQYQLSSVWSCANEIITDFATYTTGASPNGYTGDELKGFLSKYYFQGGISDDVVTSTLKLKQALVGGDDTFITRGEIDALKNMITDLDGDTAQLFPAIKNLFTDAGLTASDSDWSAAHQAFATVLNRLGGQIAQSGQTYAFNDLGALLQAWGAQLSLPANHWVYRVAKYVPIAGPAKAILIAGSSNGVAASEWQPFLASATSAYSYYRMYSRIQPASDFSKLFASSRLPWIAGGVVGLFKTAVTRRANNHIPLTEIGNLITGLGAVNWLPQNMTPTQLTPAVQFFLNKLFYQTSAPTDSLSLSTVASMQSLVNNWNSYDAALVSQNFSSTPDFGAAVKPGGTLLVLDANGRLLLPSTGTGVFHEYSAIYAVVEFVGQQWGGWPVTSDALNTAVTDWLNLLHSLGWLTGTQPSIAHSLMEEAELFMMSSDGVLDLEKAETFQYALYALSSYRSSLMLSALTSSCNGNATCIASGWAANLGSLLSNFPHLQTWLNGDSTRWGTFSQDIATVAGSDAWLMQFVVIHFIETYMARFDQNHDELINLNESLAAFPVFQPTLDVLLPANGLSTADDKPMYTYLCSFGHTPSGFSEELAYYAWKSDPSTWSYNSDRLVLAGILNSLGSL